MESQSLFNKSELEFIEKLRVARIATIDSKDKFPHIVPICFFFKDNFFYTSLRKSSKRLININKGSTISLVIDQYAEQNNQWIILRGILIKVNPSILNYKEDTELFMIGWKGLIKKYPQYNTWANEDLTPSDPDLRRIMQMKPLHKISWGFS